MLSDTCCDEMHAHFLLGEAGDDLRQLLSESSKANRIARTIAHIRTNLEGGSSIDRLAEISGTGNSALHVELRQAALDLTDTYERRSGQGERVRLSGAGAQRQGPQRPYTQSASYLSAQGMDVHADDAGRATRESDCSYRTVTVREIDAD